VACRPGCWTHAEASHERSGASSPISPLKKWASRKKSRRAPFELRSVEARRNRRPEELRHETPTESPGRFVLEPSSENAAATLIGMVGGPPAPKRSLVRWRARELAHSCRASGGIPFASKKNRPLRVELSRPRPPSKDLQKCLASTGMVHPRPLPQEAQGRNVRRPPAGDSRESSRKLPAFDHRPESSVRGSAIRSRHVRHPLGLVGDPRTALQLAETAKTVRSSPWLALPRQPRPISSRKRVPPCAHPYPLATLCPVSYLRSVGR